MKNADYDALVARIERIADTPSYPLLVLGWALFGYAVIGLGMLALVAVLVALLALVVVTKNALVAVKGFKLGVPVLIGLWVGFKSLWIRIPPPEGRRLSPADQPALFALIDKVRARGRARPVDEVLLVSDLNAGVQASPRFGLLPLYKTSLLIGLPLLQATSVAEFEAILAHEFGHLSGEHGKLGSWIYRVRRTWFQIMQHVGSHGVPGGKLMWRFLQWYIPRFGAWSFVLARRNEYEADRFAAECVGARAAADALARVSIASAADDEAFWPTLRKEVRLHALPPPDVQQRRSMQLAQAVRDERAELWLGQALKRYTDTGDTHPALRDRLKALGESARVPPPIEHNAAEQLLADALGPLQDELAAVWRQQATEGWMRERERVAQAHAQVEALAVRPELSAEEHLELARAYDQLDEDAHALAAYTAYLELQPSDAVALFAVGRLKLSLGDPAGVEVIEGAIAHNRELAVPGYHVIAAFHNREGRRTDADRYLGKVEEGVDRLEDEKREMNALTKRDELVSATIAPEVVRAVAEYLSARDEVRRAWLVRKPLTRSDTVLHVLVVDVKLGFFTTDADATTQRALEALLADLPEIGNVAAYGVRGRRWLVKRVAAVPGAQIKPCAGVADRV